MRGFDPLQPPEAVQLVTLAALQFSVVVAPGATPGGEALSCTDGDVLVETVTVALATAPPPGPLQFNVNVEFAEIAALEALPFTPLLPLQAPDAAQVSALLEFHDSVVVPPDGTLDGFADKLTVGGLCEPGAWLVELPEPPPPHAASNSDARVIDSERERIRAGDGEKKCMGGRPS